jgi:hypothetical protein
MGEWISALVGGEWPVSSSGLFTPGEIASGTRWIGGWVGTTADLGVMEKFLDLE